MQPFRAIDLTLPRAVLVLQAGLVFNAFGNGAVAPFSIIYLHDVRGIPVATAGLVAGTSAASALVAALVGGSLADRYGPRATLVGGLLTAAAAYSLYPLIREPWHAFALASAAGAGSGAYLTSQSTLVAALTPAAQRHAAFAQQRVAANLGLGLGGLAAGLIVSTTDARTFTVLFLGNAATFLVFAAFLTRIRSARPERSGPRGSYAAVLGDRTFVALAAWNLVVVAAAVSLLNSLVPVYAVNDAGATERTIGLLFLLNTLLIVFAQMPIARLQRGRRRMRGLAATGLLFSAAWALVAGAGAARSTAPLVLAFVVFGVGECIYDAVSGPLVADLAAPALLGRYMAVVGFAWQLGFVAGPAAGGVGLSQSPVAFWIVAAGVCALSGIYALSIERFLPPGVQRTPAATEPTP